RPSSTETIYGLSGSRAAARSIQLRSKAGPASVSCKRFLLQLPRHRQRRHELPAEALLPELGRELFRNMPGEDDGAVGLVGEQPRFVHDRNERAGHVHADLQRARDLADIIDDGLVEPDIVDERRGARRRADADDAAAFLLHVADERVEAQLGEHHRVAERLELRTHGLAVRLGVAPWLYARLRRSVD